MALHPLANILCNNDLALSYDEGDSIDVYWNDSTNAIRVNLNGNEVTSGGAIYAYELSEKYGYYTVSQTGYKFCDGTTLNYFNYQSSFPYMDRNEQAGSAQCSTNVCDLKFTYTIALPSTEGAKDGSIGVSVSTSSTPAKIAIGDFDRFNAGTEMVSNSHTFTGLGPGIYNIVVYDDNGCRIETDLQVDINYSSSYADLYSFSFNDHDGNSATLLIQERGFSGSVTEIQYAGPIPVSHTLESSDTDLENPVLPSSLKVDLVNLTDKLYMNQFKDADERKYLIKYYMDYGSGDVLLFQGFLTQELLTEPFEITPYISSFIATDRLADLKNFDFSLKTGDVSIIDIFVHCLKKIGIENGFRIADNLYEENQDQTAADDPWTQTFVDVKSFYNDNQPDDCLTVMEKILRPRRAQILSWGGYWYIMRIAERHTSWDYREFDSEGDYVTNSTINPVLDFYDDFKFTRDSNHLRLTSIYRSVNLQLVRKIKPSLAPEFIKENISGGGFIGWNEILGGESGSWDVEKVGGVIPRSAFPRGQQSSSRRRVFGPRVGGTRNIFSNPSNSVSTVLLSGDLTDVYVYKANFQEGQVGTTSAGINTFNGAYLTNTGNITYTKKDSLEISFDFFYQINNENMPFVTMKWMFKLGTKYLQADGTWSDSLKINDYFVEDFNKGSSFTITAEFDESFTTLTTSAYEFRVYNIDSVYADVVNTGDAALAASIRTVVTTGFSPGQRLVGKRIDVGDDNLFYLYYYELRVSGEAESGSSIIEPNDNSSLRWVQAFIYGEIAQDAITEEQSTIRYGSINIRTFPNGEELPEIKEEKYLTGQSFNQKILEVPLELFDVDVTTNNAQNLIINYFKLSNGEPCQHWGAATFNNDNKIQKQTGKEIAKQYTRSKQRISGSLRTLVPIAFYNVFRHVADSNRVYCPVGMTINYESNMIESLDMIEIKSDEEATGKAYKDNAYSSGYS